MTTREQMARTVHSNGSNCSEAVFSAFSDKAAGSAPAPRSEGGKCGAVLSAEKVLGQLNLDSASFDEKFQKKYGSLMCRELRKARHNCNDLVGTAAAYVEEAIG